jgi:hypothetical protein
MLDMTKQVKIAQQYAESRATAIALILATTMGSQPERASTSTILTQTLDTTKRVNLAQQYAEHRATAIVAKAVVVRATLIL